MLEQLIERGKLYIAKQKETARQERMASHLHDPGCDGLGDIRVVQVDRNIGGSPYEPGILGLIMECSSCHAQKATGTLQK